MIRVLIVDDSPTIRDALRRIMNSNVEMKVVGEASNGEEAVALCHRLMPDIITMDIHMPKMNGYDAIRRIMAEDPRPIVVLTSTESDIRLGTTNRAMEAGALMVLGKPHGLPGEDPEADELIAHVKAMAGVKVVGRRKSLFQKESEATSRITMSRAGVASFDIIAIGASTGGPPALRTILEQLPSHLSVSIVVVQHISRGFVKGLARWLDETTPLKVKIAAKGESLRRGVVYFAPDDQHLQVTASGHLLLTRLPKMDGHRPSVTVLFNSVVKSYGRSAVGALLTGMGRDGAIGLKALHEAGGYTLVQDEMSCVVFGMPKEAIELGAAKEVLPINRIGKRLGELIVNNEQLSRKK